MKKILINFSFSLIISLLFGLIICFILALLKQNNIVNNNFVNIVINIFSILLFFLFGFLFSIKQKRLGLLNGLALVLINVFLYFILSVVNISTSPIFMVVFRSLAILLGSIFGVNIFRNDQI